MKNILMGALASLFVGTAAQAGVYKCQNLSDRPGTGDYLLALKADSGIVFQNRVGYMQALDHEVRVLRAMDGGPVRVLATPVKPEIDWSKERACFKWGKAQMSFTVKMGAAGDQGSTVQYFPTIYIQPNTMCSAPRPRVAPPQRIVCELL